VTVKFEGHITTVFPGISTVTAKPTSRFWRPSTGTWYIRYSSSGYNPATFGQYQWGLPGDVPVSGDFDGDRKTDLVVFRPSSGGWLLRLSSAGYSINSFAYYQWGLPGDQPIALDFDGDGTDDLVVFRQDTGEWYMLFSSNGFSTANYGWAQWACLETCFQGKGSPFYSSRLPP
jgi:hypothetical protein